MFRRAFRHTLTRDAFGLVSVTGMLLAVVGACRSEIQLCTAEEAGRGGATRLERRALPQVDTKTTDCQLREFVVRSDAELRVAYRQIGLNPIDADAGAPSGERRPEDIDFPAVDWSRETVVVRESVDNNSVAWMVFERGVITLGTRACVNLVGTCRVEVFAVAAVAAEVTSIDEHACEGLNCALPTNR